MTQKNQKSFQKLAFLIGAVVFLGIGVLSILGGILYGGRLGGSIKRDNDPIWWAVLTFATLLIGSASFNAYRKAANISKESVK